MADKADWSIVLRLAIQGDKQTKQSLDEIQKAVDQLNKEGKLTEKQYEQTSKALIRTGNAASTAKKDHDSFTNGLIQQRYALYDVAATYGAYSAAITAAGTASVVAFAKQERAFTNVERTAEGSLGNIREALMDLSTTIPVAFTDLANTATLGNQLGIATEDLQAFTETVTAFSTVTGISIDSSAQAFGKLGNLLGVSADDYDRLASAISYAGRTTAATESQIISIAQEIAPAAASAGFAADEVVGLSAALGSIRVPPERSRSTILQFFETLNTAVANGGQDLENFAKVVGVTTSELDSMVRSGQGQDILSRFVNSAAASDTIEVTQALQALGLAGLRTNPTIRALKDNTDLLATSLNNSKQAYADNTELQYQMAFILDDLSTKWSTTVNAVVNLAAALGGTLAPVIGPLLDGVKGLVIGFTDFINTPIGGFITNVVAVIVGATAAYAAYRAAIALSTASTYALITAQKGLAASGVGARTSMGLLASTLGVLGGNSATAAGGLRTVTTALKGVAKATVIIAVLQVIIGLFTDLRGTVQGAGEAVVWFGQVLENISFGIPKLVEGARQIQDFGRGVQDWSKTLPGAADNLVDVADAGSSFDPSGFETGVGALDDLADSAGKAADRVYTLVDYASDLASVWSRAFDIRFGGQTTMDAIATSFQQVRDASAEAEQNVRSLNAEISGLNSDINIQTYFLGIAQNYGDSKRVEAIQANLAKLQSDLADKTANLSKEQAKNDRTLTGNTAAAIANRDTIRGLVQQYQAHIAALASSGLSQEELARRTEELRADFVNQATQLGYNQQELGLYEQAFYDVKVAIDNVPRDITVNANVNPALQALNEFVARAKQAGADASSGLSSSFNSGLDGLINDAGIKAIQLGATLGTNIISSLKNQGNGRARAGGGSFGGPFDGNPLAQLAYDLGRNIRGYADGGYTGQGGMNQPAGIVHRGEYVIPKRHVNQSTGLPKADALGRLHRGASGRSGYAGGGLVSGGGLPSTISLSAMTIQQIGQAVQPHLFLDGKEVAQSSSRQYATSTATGAN